jgi:hypothetical protein
MTFRPRFLALPVGFAASVAILVGVAPTAAMAQPQVSGVHQAAGTTSAADDDVMGDTSWGKCAPLPDEDNSGCFAPEATPNSQR